jgi:hypothetical protein
MDTPVNRLPKYGYDSIFDLTIRTNMHMRTLSQALLNQLANARRCLVASALLVSSPVVFAQNTDLAAKIIELENRILTLESRLGVVTAPIKPSVDFNNNIKRLGDFQLEVIKCTRGSGMSAGGVACAINIKNVANSARTFRATGIVFTNEERLAFPTSMFPTPNHTLAASDEVQVQVLSLSGFVERQVKSLKLSSADGNAVFENIKIQ